MINPASAGRRWLRSAQARFFLLLVLVQLLLAAAILLVTARQLHRDISERDIAALAQLRDDLVIQAEEGNPARLARSIAGRTDEFNLKGEVVLLAKADGTPVAGNITAWPKALVTPAQRQQLKLTRDEGAPPRAYLLLAQWLSQNDKLLVGRAAESSDALRASVSSAVLVALGISLPLALIGAWAAMRVIDARIDRINATAAAVTRGLMGTRVPLAGSGDRFDRLAGNVNAMLDRIEALVEELRALSDALAHDLRSPITRLRSRVDAVRAEATGDMVPLAALASVSREADQLLVMLNGVLAISRAEAGLGRDQMTRLDLAEIAQDLADLYEPLAEEQGRIVRAETSGPAMVLAHRHLIGQALANLIDNALKHGAGDIVLAVTRSGDTIRLAVRDGGEGIAPEAEALALSRFSRLDAARSTPGGGLGLSLVAALARLHEGALLFERPVGGFAVVLSLPALRD